LADVTVVESNASPIYPFSRPFDAKSVDVARYRTAHVRVKRARQVSRMNSRDASERLVIEAAPEVRADELPRCGEPARWATARRGARVVRLGEKSVHEALDCEVGDRIVGSQLLRDPARDTGHGGVLAAWPRPPAG